MKEERILQVLGEVNETYIAEAAPKEIRQKKPVLRKLMIVAACLGLLLTSGCAAVAVSPEVRAAVQSIIEILFPPKEVIVTPEGLPESVPHAAQGQEPTENAPGFAIYVDEGSYEMTEENGVFVIRPKKSSLSREDVRQNNSALLEGLTVEEQEAFIDNRLAEQEAFYAALPPCEMEIRELEGKDLEAVATAIRTEMTQTWETVTEIENEDFRLSFLASGGTAWDAPQENHYFYPYGEQRVYHIIIRYYSEAEEGHGSRFRTMLETFSVIDSTSITQPQVHTVRTGYRHKKSLCGSDESSETEEDYYMMSTSLTAEEVEQFAVEIKNDISKNNWDALAEKISYPIVINGIMVNNREDFLKLDIDGNLNQKFVDAINAETCRKMFCNWQGVRMGDTGQIWFANVDNGKGTMELLIIGINDMLEE